MILMIDYYLPILVSPNDSRIGVVGESSLLILHGTLGDEDDIYDDQMKSNAFRTRILCSHAMPLSARATDFEVISAQG